MLERALAAGLCGALAAAAPSPARAAAPPPLLAAHAAVASDHPASSEAGLAAMRGGGNAIDAACAVALTFDVTYPAAAGMGGGGFAVIYLAKERKAVALDFREKAPAAIKPGMFLNGGKPDPEASTSTGLAIGVPGEVRGLSEMVRRWGKLPFGKCVEAAEHLAKAGAKLPGHQAEMLESGFKRLGLPKDPKLAAIFYPGGKPLGEGAILKRPDLAGTYGKLRKSGADALYTGEIAEAIVAAARERGGVLTLDDLKAYAPVERKPLETRYRGASVYSMPPPSSGGIAVGETLGILEAKSADLSKLGHDSSAYLHVLAEAFKHAFADRARHLGDADFVRVPQGHLADPAYHKELAARIKDGAVLPRDAYGTPDSAAAMLKDGGTTHLCVIDADGNAVALTTTVNLGFGSKIMAGKTGIVLNNQMDDFSLLPGVPNAFGLIGNAQNAVAPGKRPLSSMSPTIVVDDQGVKLVAGAGGGPRIITGTTQVILNVLDFKMDAQAAVAAPRVHHQWVPDALEYEADLPRDVVDALEKRGHRTKAANWHVGATNLLVRTDKGIEAAADPRIPAAPAGY